MKAIVTTVSAMLVAFAIQAQEPAKKAATQTKEGAEKVKTEAAKKDMPAVEKGAAKVESAAGTVADPGKPIKPAAEPKGEATKTNEVEKPKK
jgi:hypothetical protein